MLVGIIPSCDPKASEVSFIGGVIIFHLWSLELANEPHEEDLVCEVAVTQMVGCIKRCFAESSTEEFNIDYPSMHMSQYSWDQIVATIESWLDPDEYTSKVPDVSFASTSLFSAYKNAA